MQRLPNEFFQNYCDDIDYSDDVKELNAKIEALEIQCANNSENIKRLLSFLPEPKRALVMLCGNEAVIYYQDESELNDFDVIELLDGVPS